MERIRPPLRHALCGLTLAALVGLGACGESTTPTEPDPPGNTAPVAAAGADQTVSATLPVRLDGSASTDADGDAVTYAWSLTATPSGSAAALDDAASETPSFTPDVPGAYSVQLVVSDGTDESAPDNLTITAEDNTSTQMIGSGGGTIMSVDGSVSLEIPAGALAADEEITMTLVPAGQRPEELDGLDAEEVVYEFKPDGLTFDVPARVVLELPDAFDASMEGGETSVPLLVVSSLSGGDMTLAGEQQFTVDPGSGAVTASADIEHFSHLVIQPLPLGEEGASGQLAVLAVVPETVEVGDEFAVEMAVVNALINSADLAAGFAEADWGDRAESPIEPFGGATGGTFVQEPVDELFLRTFGDWVCTDVSGGTWAAEVEVRVASSHILLPHLADPDETIRFRIDVASEVACTEPPQPDFSSLGAFGPEGLDYARNPDGSGYADALLITQVDGVVIADGGGAIRATIEDEGSGATFNRVAGVADDGFIAATSAGLRAFFGALRQFVSDGELEPPGVLDFPVPPSAPGRRLDAPMRAVPDVSTNATDVVVGGTGDDMRIAAVLFGDRNLAFYIPRSTIDGTPGFVPDGSLAEAFKDDGGSVFGNTRPVSAWVGPNGFDEDNPMLVVTIDDAIQSSQLWKVDLVAGQAQLTEVDNVFIDHEVRTVRCLEGICAVGAYGGAFGFGSLTFFSWDGEDAFSPIQGIAGRTIGIDLIRSGDSVLIARTLFNSNQYSVFEISVTGEFLDSTFNDAPEGCTGPGHIVFRNPDEVILTCNTSGLVVADRHGLGSGG